MHPYIDVTFPACDRDAAIVAEIHRSVARLELAHPVHRASIALHRRGRATSIDLAVTLDDGQLVVATTSQRDAYVAVAEAFRAVERRIVNTAEPRGFAAAA